MTIQNTKKEGHEQGRKMIIFLSTIKCWDGFGWSCSVRGRWAVSRSVRCRCMSGVLRRCSLWSFISAADRLEEGCHVTRMLSPLICIWHMWLLIAVSESRRGCTANVTARSKRLTTPYLSALHQKLSYKDSFREVIQQSGWTVKMPSNEEGVEQNTPGANTRVFDSNVGISLKSV